MSHHHQVIARFLSILVLTLGLANGSVAKPIAGEVLLAVGQAWVESDGATEQVRRGRAITVGERLVTRDGGHVHVRMSDGGLIAVRPNSTLEFQVFDYDPQQPGSGKVRYALQEGVARSVTGRIGDANKQAFRFNTPIAAIGVRGTDFVAQHDMDATRVAVRSGAVVVGSLGNGCQADAFGACGGQALTLSAGDQSRLVEVALRDGVPRLKRDGVEALGPERISTPHPSEPIATSSANEETRRGRIDTTLPVEAASVAPPLPSHVFWGRWSRSVAGEDIKAVSQLLAEGKKIHVANHVFGMGVESLPAQLPDRGRADFQVVSATAYLGTPGGLSPASVTGGNLSVDFAARQFSTDFNVAAGGGNYSVNAAGSVDVRGYLLSDAGRSNAEVVGALDSTLRQAGTLFERNIDNGRGLTGAIRWGR